MSTFRFPPPPPPPPTHSADPTDHHGYQTPSGRGNGQRGHRGRPHSHDYAGRGSSEGQRGGHGPHRGRGGQPGYMNARGGNADPVTGEKRKWSDRGGRGGSHQRGGQHAHPPPPHQQQQHSRNPQMGVAPAVPSFGFSLPYAAAAPPPPPPPSSRAEEPAASKARRRHNVLGLTPKGAEREDSDQEVDEEAAFAARLLVQSGGLPNVQNRAEMVAWLAERRRRYPTRARLEEREKAAREAELERLRQRVRTSRDANQGRAGEKKGGDGADAAGAGARENRRREKLERHLRKAEKLRRQLEGARSAAADTVVGAGTPGTAKPSLLGANYDSDDDDDDDGGPDRDGAAEARDPAERELRPTASDADSDTSSLSSSSDDSDSDSDSSSAPEEASSKQGQPEQPLPQPQQQQPQQQQPQQQQQQQQQQPPPERRPRERERLPEHLIPWVKRGFCRDFIQQQPCRYGRRCRNKHFVPQELRDAKVPRRRLFDRLVEQEARAENAAAVGAIKALGATGFFSGV